MSPLITSIMLCAAAFGWLLWIQRRDKISLGLPLAYLFGLLLIHVPGAIAHLVGNNLPTDTLFTNIGIRFTVIGAWCFVAGVWLARRPVTRMPTRRAVDRRQFAMFCLLGGWFFTYGLSFLGRIPSLGAAVEKGGAVWMLGVIIGLRAALARGDSIAVIFWLSALAVYPTLMLLLGGFLSYGSTAAIIVLAGIAITIRSHLRVVVGVTLISILAFNLFLNYFDQRDTIRDAVWGGAPMAVRIEVTLDTVRDFEWFDSSNPRQLSALDKRLNQNYFVGLAAERIENGRVDYLRGRSLWEGLLGLVPRAIWPGKPVFAGSPKIIAEMTGLFLNPNTSYGVGNVMEFHINFGIPGLVIGFFALGWLLAMLDRRAALAWLSGDLGRMFFYFLPAVALIQPNGSMVELTMGSAAALVAAFGWNWAWNRWNLRHP